MVYILTNRLRASFSSMTLINSLQLQVAVSSDSGRGCAVKSVFSLTVGYSALGHKAL